MLGLIQVLRICLVSEIESKFPNTSALVKKNDFNPNVTEVDYKILNLTDSDFDTKLNDISNRVTSIKAK